MEIQPQSNFLEDKPEKHLPLKPQDSESAALELPDFVNVEANLATLGFFTPSQKRVKTRKTYRFTRIVNGQKREQRVTFVPTDLGLPTAPADQDKYLALMKLITDSRKQGSELTNPIAVTTTEILRLLGKHRHSGKNFKEVKEWLERMTGTLIISEQAVYFSDKNDKKNWRSATFHVFESVVSRGSKMEDGKIAEKHYIFLSDWQLNNLRRQNSFPVDWETYKLLSNNISKALLFPLELMLFATREQGRVVKRYDELCSFLNIKQHKYPSVIKQTLGPSLDELKQFGYIRDWNLEKTADGTGFKIVFWHGSKFYKDHRLPDPLADKQKQGIEKLPEQSSVASVDPEMLSALIDRDIPKSKAIQLIEECNGDFWDQLAYLDHRIAQSEIGNPAGFYIRGFDENWEIPDSFAKKKEAQQKIERERQKRALEEQYYQHKNTQIDAYLKENADQWSELLNDNFRELAAKYLNRDKPFLSEDQVKDMAEHQARARLASDVLGIPSLEDWIEQHLN